MQPLSDVHTGWLPGPTATVLVQSLVHIPSNSYLQYQQEQICRLSHSWREKKNDLDQQAANSHEGGHEILQAREYCILITAVVWPKLLAATLGYVETTADCASRAPRFNFHKMLGAWGTKPSAHYCFVALKRQPAYSAFKEIPMSALKDTKKLALFNAGNQHQ